MTQCFQKGSVCHTKITHMALRGVGWILLTAVVVLSFSAENSVSTLDELAGLAPYPEVILAQF